MRTIVVWLAALLLSAPPLAAQQDGTWDATGLHMSRAELQELLARLEDADVLSAYSGAVLAQARAEAALIRVRLEEGDIRVGDRIMLRVEGQLQLSDTFTVVDGRRVVLPELGDVQLAGVLRSELQQHVTEHIARFIRDPIVHARSLVRMQIMGAVGRPGFYTIPSDILIGDALMLAGGPAGNADVTQLQIHRGGLTIWEGQRLQEALVQGRTLDQLSVRAGDGIHVPERRTGFDRFSTVLMVLSGVSSVVFLVVRLGLF